jgi:hypothetical protein
MGYRWKQLKEEREKQLRAIRARELTSQATDLFTPRPDTYSSVYTCQQKNGTVDVVAGTNGLLTLRSGGRVAFWAGGTVGFLCAEDAADLLLHFPQATEESILCIGRVAEEPNAFRSFKLEILPVPKKGAN